MMGAARLGSPTTSLASSSQVAEGKVEVPEG
jgi:hypothetical protein